IEHAELDAPAIGHAAHQSVECVDLTDQVTLAETADRRIARHGADGRDFVGDECSRGTHARRRSRSLTAGMPAAHDDHIEPRVHLTKLSGGRCLYPSRSTGSKSPRRIDVSRETAR